MLGFTALITLVDFAWVRGAYYERFDRGVFASVMLPMVLLFLPLWGSASLFLRNSGLVASGRHLVPGAVLALVLLATASTMGVLVADAQINERYSREP